jgi:hypothetical protein
MSNRSMSCLPNRVGNPGTRAKSSDRRHHSSCKDVWVIRGRLQLAHRERELALVNLGIDSKLRARDLVQLRDNDICHGDRVASRAVVMQQTTHRPVQFEITEQTREAVAAWIRTSAFTPTTSCFVAARIAGTSTSPTCSTNQAEVCP